MVRECAAPDGEEDVRREVSERVEGCEAVVPWGEVTGLRALVESKANVEGIW